MSSKTLRKLAAVASATLVLGAFVAGPAEAKKKKPKPPPVPAACPAFTPGEEGAAAQTSVVTDAATAEAPVVVELTAAPGLGNDLGLADHAYDETTAVYQHVQVDTANPSAGLYARIDFSDHHDYDLYLNNAAGETAATSGEFNVLPEAGAGSGAPEGAWAAGSSYESVLGINTPDCGGYTTKIVSFLTTGGNVTVSYWLGEVVAEPEA